jgi:uncharacterized protein (DUF983 family)
MADPYARAMNNKCPHCGQGLLFDGWVSLREKCTVCGARYERYEGAWTGPTVIGYGSGAAMGIAMGFALVMSGHYFAHAEIVIALIACTTVLLVYRFIKAWWMGWLHASGYIYPDPPRSVEPIVEVEPPT